MKDVFKEKYLEYEPKITLEIFTLVWNRLLELGYKSFKNATIEERYDEFKGVCNYFRTTYDHPNEFNCYYDGNDYTKTTVEEILGYNPFIKDDFVLPKKWCIKIQANGIPYEVAQWRKLSWSNPGYMSSSGTWHCDNAIGYPEITLDQFKKYVLKESIETKEVIPEYVELLPGFDTPRTGEIFDTKRPTPDYPRWTKSWTWEYLLTAEIHKHYFKPSTKEAYDKQVKELIGYKEQKPIEKWSFGSYIVFLQDKVLTRSGEVTKGKVYQITDYGSVGCPYFYADNGSLINFVSKDSDKYGLKWFATKSEAEEFAKTLVEPTKAEVKQPLKQAVHCQTQEEWDFFILKEVSKSHTMSKKPFQKDSAITFTNSWDRVDYLKNNDYQILSFQEWCDLNGYKMEKEVKQPLKQVVHCQTKEEWDFVSEKINYKFATAFDLGVKDTINLSDEKCDHKLYYEKHSGYQILSFQEWCDLNGYKMEKELKRVGNVWYKWVKHRNDKDGLKYVKSNYFSENTLHYLERINVDGTHVYRKSECVWDEELVEVSLSEIQQYLPEGHPDKISSVKDTVILNESSIGKFISFRYNNRFYNKALIVKENGNIYLLNNCHPNNDGHKDKSIYNYSLKFNNFKEVESLCKEIKFLTTEEVPKPKMILSIDDEELPMVNISKTNSLKQLLNLE